MIFPRHVELHLEHNPHNGYHETVRVYLETVKSISFADQDEKQKAISLDELWVLQWYPDTSIGFFQVGAATLDACLAFAIKVGGGT
jgi:hypothetical protein